jgi:siroheme synthase
MDAGVRAQTPCAVISGASTREQRIAVRTVCSMQEGLDLPSPSLLIVGEVVRLAQAFDVSRVHFQARLNGELSASMRELGQLTAEEVA